VLSVAIVGAGRVGQTRAKVIRRSDRALLAAVADVDRARAEKVAEGTPAVVSSDWSSVVTRNDIDAIVVSTPTKFHSEVTIAASKPGNMYCAKNRWAAMWTKPEECSMLLSHLAVY